jgi:hypothetical protein
MSTAPASPAPKAPTRSEDEVEIRIVSHSTLFYWWPVWAIGLLLGLASLFLGDTMAIVPTKSEVHEGATIQYRGETDKLDRDIIVLPKGEHIPKEQTKEKDNVTHLKFHAYPNKTFGLIFATVLLLVIVITNVPLRGMWSVVAIMTIVMLVIIFSLAGWWDAILGWLYLLHIYINAAGYIAISVVLLILWFLTFYFFDKQVYMVFTPGQMKVQTEIGGGEVAYDTTGMTIQKQRSDLFRHWILGLGSGDLLVTTTGAAAHHFDLPNVLFIGKKVQLIEDMLREKAVVRGR